MFSNWLTSTSSSSAAAVSSTGLSPNAPDVILEIGPMPFSRFAAHSAILAAHSGYLRSVLRPEERISDCPIYVPNITADHFAPLLTYMYTGFLDLTIENIFGVLLATHVLHMPRALEICRNFLQRIQPDGYLNSFLPSTSMHTAKSIEKVRAASSIGDPVKVIRPIASKATNSGFAFIVPPISKPLLPSHETPFKSLGHSTTHTANYDFPKEINVEKVSSEDDLVRKSPIASTSQSQSVLEGHEMNKESDTAPKNPLKFRKRSHSKTKPTHSPTLEIAKLEAAPAGIEDCESDKVVIDVASCDGPVRFQRVLNDAYGRYPIKSTSFATKPVERKHSHMANSFHLQMARNISERQSIETSAIDSENSEEIVVHEKSKKDDRKYKSSSCVGKADEVYCCVYCKHTFKSQYCYQKHAKRHLNPLSIDRDVVVDTVDSDKDDKSEKSLMAINVSATTTTSMSSSSSSSTTTSSPVASVADRNKSAMIKREVRPLDMNVQYYPCKTCGSKFPSYYFVHKHRKLCHANEEN